MKVMTMIWNICMERSTVMGIIRLAMKKARRKGMGQRAAMNMDITVTPRTPTGVCQKFWRSSAKRI